MFEYVNLVTRFIDLVDLCSKKDKPVFDVDSVADEGFPVVVCKKRQQQSVNGTIK